MGFIYLNERERLLFNFSHRAIKFFNSILNQQQQFVADRDDDDDDLKYEDEEEKS